MNQAGIDPIGANELDEVTVLDAAMKYKGFDPSCFVAVGSLIEHPGSRIQTTVDRGERGDMDPVGKLLPAIRAGMLPERFEIAPKERDSCLPVLRQRRSSDFQMLIDRP